MEGGGTCGTAGRVGEDDGRRRQAAIDEQQGRGQDRDRVGTLLVRTVRTRQAVGTRVLVSDGGLDEERRYGTGEETGDGDVAEPAAGATDGASTDQVQVGEAQEA